MGVLHLDLLIIDHSLNTPPNMSPSNFDPYDTPFEPGIFEMAASFEFERLSQPYSDEADGPLSFVGNAGRGPALRCRSLGRRERERCSPRHRRNHDSQKEVAERRLHNWEGRNLEAHLLIDRMLGPDYRLPSRLAGTESAKELWDKIREIHVEAGKGMKAVRVLRRMHARKYEEGTLLAEFEDGFHMDNMLLQEYGVGMDDKLLATTIIQALPWHDDTTAYTLYPVMDKIFDDKLAAEEYEPTVRLLWALRDIDSIKKLRRSSATEAGSSQGKRNRKGH